VLAGALVALTATATPAFAATVTQPTSNPFVVPGNASGTPYAVTVVASGYNPGDNVYIEQCDGTPPSTVGWDATLNCDLGTSPAPTIADASGKATFSAFDVNHRFTPFKGLSPQGLFSCRAPQDPPAASPSFTSCQVRVSTNNTGPTSDQVFYRLTLPNPTTKLSCVIKGSLGFSKAPTNAAPKKPKATKVKGSATVGTAAGTACNNANAPAAATKYPVTSGTIKIKGSLPVGTNCSQVLSPKISGVTFSIKWAGLKGTKLSNAGKSTMVPTSMAVGAVPASGYVISGPITGGAFAGSTARIQVVTSSAVQSLSNACNAGSLATIGFTATTSSIAVL
jgi:hypothetical protein